MAYDLLLARTARFQAPRSRRTAYVPLLALVLGKFGLCLKLISEMKVKMLSDVEIAAGVKCADWEPVSEELLLEA